MKKRDADQPLISLVVPVYNVEKYLRECLDSIVGQSLKDIEIICVEDCSTDGSRTILEEYANGDSRIRPVFFNRNRSLCVTRREGTLQSRGKYLMFVDSDDYLSPNVCEELYNLMEKYGSDMIQFSSELIAENEKEERLSLLRGLLKPWEGSLKGNLIHACFAEHRFYPQVWNKIYRGDLIRKAMTECPDKNLPKAQDYLEFFITAYYAETYRGVKTKGCYYYRVGSGVTGGRFLDRGKIQKCGMQLEIITEIRNFLQKQGDTEKYSEELEEIDERLTSDALIRLTENVRKEDISFGWATYQEHRPGLQLLARLAKVYYQREEKALSLCRMIQSETEPQKKITTIGAFYPRLSNGGVQQVMARLSALWTDMGYRIVLLTEDEPGENDYDLPDDVKRYCLPKLDGLSGEEVRSRSMERITRLTEIIRNEKIDLMVYHQWLGSFLLWDMTAVKLAGAAFCIYCHSVFSVPLIEKTLLKQYRLMPEIYAGADRIICLTEVDRYYWSRYNGNVHLAVNPLTFSAADVKPRTDCTPVLLWVGRLSREKRPEDALYAMREIRSRIPDAKLLMVGGGDPKEESILKELAERENLGKNVELCGFHKDVKPFYRKASVLLNTSEYESFSLTIAEAQANGMPVICYDLPYLQILEGSKGSVRIPSGDVSALADEAVRLLTDRERYIRLSEEAVQNIQRLDIDLKELWQGILESSEPPGRDLSKPEKVDRMALDIIRQHVTMRESNAVQNGGISCSVLDTAFPIPTSGHFRILRRKMALAARVLLIDGPGAAVRRMKGKMGKGSSRIEKKGE